MLYLHGTQAEFQDCQIPNGEGLLDLILNAKAGTKQFGQPCFVRTRFGLRVPDDARWSKSDEAHRDQTLAMLGHLGVPANTAVTLEDGVATVADAIHDSVATFDLNSAELEWSAWAYAMYLTPLKRWTNRFGETFTFDRVVEALRSRSLPAASCGGTHVLLSLTMIMRADKQFQILSTGIRHELQQFLSNAVGEAVVNQQSDGSWKIDWHKSLVTDTGKIQVRDSLRDRLIATGHIAEWLLYVPEVLQPPEEVFRRAAIWLSAELRRVEQEQAELFCPYTHGLFVVIRGSEAVSLPRS